MVQYILKMVANPSRMIRDLYLSLKYQNETFFNKSRMIRNFYCKTWCNTYWKWIQIHQEWSGIFISKHGAIHIECALNLSLKYQNETFLINQEWSGIFIAKHGAIHIDCAMNLPLKYQNETFLFNKKEWSGIRNAYWKPTLNQNFKNVSWSIIQNVLHHEQIWIH